MSDKPEKKEAAAAPAAAGDEKKAAEGGGGGGFLTKLPVLLGGVMIIEAAVLFTGFKMFGGAPKQASAVELAKDEGKGAEGAKGEKGEGGKAGPADKKAISEIHIVDDFRSPNNVSGKLYFYDVTVVATAKGDAADKLKERVDARGALIKDRIRTIIAASDPGKLGGGSEPGLETFRRQVKFQLDEIVGDGLIDEVVVPKCTPFPGY